MKLGCLSRELSAHCVDSSSPPPHYDDPPLVVASLKLVSPATDATPTTPGSIAGDMEVAEENSIVSVKERALKLNKIQSESELQKQISPPRKKTVRSAVGLLVRRFFSP